MKSIFNIKYFKTAIIAAFFASLFSCGDCGLETSTIYVCRCYNAHIDRLDPTLDYTLLGDTVVNMTGVDSYSIGTFIFPSSNAETGTIVNENFGASGFAGLWDMYAAPRIDFSIGSENYIAAIDNKFPTNANMEGDIMVVSVDMTGSRSALLRFKGELALFPISIVNDDCSEFCNALESYRAGDAEYAGIQSRLTKYGLGLSDQSKVFETRKEDIVVFSRITGATTTIQAAKDARDELLVEDNTTAVDVLVRRGEVYYYRARNGKDFAVMITDINAGSLSPFKERVSIKYSGLKAVNSHKCE